MSSDRKFLDDDRFDGLYMNVAQTTRGIEPLLDTVFSFLRRKTDFFSGPPGATSNLEEGQAQALAKVQEVFQKHARLHRNERQAAEAKKKPKAKKSTTTTATTTPAAKKKPEPKVEENVVEMGADGGFDISNSKEVGKEKDASNNEKDTSESVDNSTTATTTTTTPPSSDPAPSDGNTEPTKDAEAQSDKEEEEDSKRPPPPLGNGGTVPGKYVWTQTLSEVTVTMPLPENTRGRDLNVTIAKKHWKVALRSAPKDFLVDAPLTRTIIMDDSFWTVEDGNRLVVNLQKLDQQEWWDAVCKGDPTIDVKTIQPENSRLADLDGETRQTVEKMMYDQRQKALGLPSSEEEHKMAMLEKFKKQHPELDFSQAKIT